MRLTITINGLKARKVGERKQVLSTNISRCNKTDIYAAPVKYFGPSGELC